MDINYELYKVFYYVAKTLSFSEAAQSLYISQSAVSQSIKVLEKRLDRQLFTRSTKRVTLTKEGEMLFKHIEPAVTLICKGEKQLLHARKTGEIMLRIASSDTICRYFLVPYFEKFKEAYPDIHLKIVNGTSKSCAEMLLDGTVDLVITNSPNPALNDTVSSEQLCTFKDVFVANRKFFPVENNVLSFEELGKLPILMLESHSTTSEYLHEQFIKHSLELVPAVELSSNDLLIDLAEIGLGVAFVPDYALSKRNNEDLVVINTKEDMAERKLVAAYSAGGLLSQPATYFLQLIRDGQ